MPFGCFVRYFFLNFPLSNSLGPCERWKRGKGSTIRVSWKSELCTHTLTHIHWYLCQCSSNVSLLSLYASSWCRFCNTCKQTYGAELQKEMLLNLSSCLGGSVFLYSGSAVLSWRFFPQVATFLLISRIKSTFCFKPVIWLQTCLITVDAPAVWILSWAWLLAVACLVWV